MVKVTVNKCWWSLDGQWPFFKESVHDGSYIWPQLRLGTLFLGWSPAANSKHFYVLGTPFPNDCTDQWLLITVSSHVGWPFIWKHLGAISQSNHLSRGDWFFWWTDLPLTTLCANHQRLHGSLQVNRGGVPLQSPAIGPKLGNPTADPNGQVHQVQSGLSNQQ